MTQLVNIQIPDNRILDPMLADLVRKLALDKPQWIFSWKKSNEWNYNNPLINKLDADGNIVEAPEDMQFLRRVRVLEGGEQLGALSVGYRYGRCTTYVYDIESWRIEKQRGHHNVTSTEKLDIAVRKAKKLFAKMDYAEIMNKADTAIRTGMYTSLRELKNPIDRSSLIKDEVMLQKYVFCEVRGLPMPDSIKRPIRELFESPKYEEHMSQYELAVETELMLSRGQMTSVAVHNGLYLYKDANTDELHAVEFDQMSEAWQNRIAVLQLMADHEVVRDVGYRYNDTNFYIVI